MEEKLRKLLTDLIKEETSRKETIMKISADIEQEKERLIIKEKDELERFDEGFKADIESGLYNNRNKTQLELIENEAKNSIKERYNREKEVLNEKLENAQKLNEDNNVNAYKQVNSQIKEYHIDMVLEANKAQRELTDLEKERNEALNEINKKIAEKEARQTHMMIRNREFMDIENTQISADIRILGMELEQLREERQLLSSEYDAKIETQSQYLEYCIEQKDKAAKLLGQIISNRPIEEIYNELFKNKQQDILEEEQPVEEVEEEKPIEEVEEEQPVVEVEEEQPIEEVEEEQPVVEVEEEQPIEKVEEEQPIEKVEEEQPIEEVEEEQPVVEVEEEQPIEEVKEEQPVVKAEEKPPVVQQQKTPNNTKRTISEDERNYQFFQKNQKSIVDYFMYITGVKEKEATRIFAVKEHCLEIGKISREAMKKNDKNELTKKMQSYYWGIDSRLDIEVSSEGIRYNDEEIEPLDITVFGDDEYDNVFINKIVDKFEQAVSAVPNGNVVYDENIIKAIAMDNYTVDDKGNMKLTMSGNKKLNEYLRITVDPKYKKGSVTYNLEKVSLLHSLFNPSTWSPRKVMEIQKIANQTRKSYATIIPGMITKYQWAIQHWFNGIKTKKITAGEQEVQPKQERKNPWKVSQTHGLYERVENEKIDNRLKSTEQREKDSDELEI